MAGCSCSNPDATAAESCVPAQDPLTWTIYGMISSQLSDVADEMIALEDGTRVTVSTYVFDTYNYRHKVRKLLQHLLPL